MALYKEPAFLNRHDSPDFDRELAPGTDAPHSGIYRCTGCGREVTSEEPNPLPPQNHHQHAATLMPIRWRLIVYADHNAKQ